MAWYWPFNRVSNGTTPASNTNKALESSATASDIQNARKSVASSINKGALSAKNTTAFTGENVKSTAEEAPSAVEQQDANVTENIAAPVENKVEKLKNKRPGINSHDSVSDKFKHAFKLDHRQHHPQKDITAITPET